MKNYFLTFIIICFSISSFSQSENGNEIIVEGNAKMKVKPDLASFRISVVKKDPSESNAVKKLNKEIDALLKSLNSLGFTDSSIKIADYEILKDEGFNLSKIESKKNYIASNSIIVRFGLDTKIIDAFYRQIELSNFEDLDIIFNTHISENLEILTRQKLVQIAIEDAKRNAKNIADALNIKILGIKKVSKTGLSMNEDFKTSIFKFTPPVLYNKSSDHKDVNPSSFNKLQVEEIELNESITIIYEIPKNQSEKKE